MFSKSKRFTEAAERTPGVGQYDVEIKQSSKTTLFTQDKRFNDNANKTKDPNLDISNCSTRSLESTSSNNSNVFVTPGKPFRLNKSLSSSSISRKTKSRQESLSKEKENLSLTISNLRREIDDLKHRNEILEKTMTENKNSFERKLELTAVDHKTKMDILELAQQEKLSLLTQLMEEKNSLENAIALSETRINTLQGDLKEATESQTRSNDEVKTLIEERELCHLKIEELTTKNEESHHKAHEQLSQLRDEMRRKEDQSLQNLQNLSGKCQDLETQLATVKRGRQAEIESLQKELDLSNLSLNKVQEEYKVMNQVFKELRSNYDNECANRVKLQSDLSHVTGAMRMMESELATAKGRIGEFEAKDHEHSQSVEILTNKLIESNNTVTVLQEKELENDKITSENKSLKNELQELNKQLNKISEGNKSLSSSEEKMNKLKQEIGRRLVETQKKLSQKEIELESCRKEFDEHLLSCQPGEIWKTKFEELEARISPFQEQLDAFEFEKQALLSRNSESQSEIDKLGQQYAKLLGHQNNKQKIRHVLKLKEENIDLKKEVAKLREQTMKQKQTIRKLEESSRKTSGVRKFDPANAFQHSALQNKENTPLKK